MRKPASILFPTMTAVLFAVLCAAAGRLSGYGVGPLAPVAGNRTEEGRAKNRRVELVER